MSLTRTKETAGRVLTTKPNWSRAVTETYEFQTRVWESRDKTQQRVCQRAHPRVSIALKSDQVGARMRAVYQEAQEGTQGDPQVFAAQWRTAAVDGDLLAGAAGIPLVDQPPWWIAVGGYVVLESDSAIEAVRVAGLSGSVIVCEEALSLDHSGHVRVHLGLYGYVSERRRLEAIVSPHTGGTVQFNAKPGFLGAAKPAPSLDTWYYHALPIFEPRPNWSEKIKLTVMDGREIVDFSYGHTDEYYYLNQLELTSSWLFTGKTQAQVDELLSFFMNRRGRQKPFWACTHLSDFGLTAPASQGSSSLAVEGDYSAFDEDVIHRAVVVIWPDGKRQINGVVSAGDGFLTMLDGWARDVTSDTTISWAFPACFGSDTFEIDWLSDGVAQVNISVQAIPGDPFTGFGGNFLTVNYQYGATDALVWGSTPSPSSWGQIDLGREFTQEDLDKGRGAVSTNYSGVMEAALGVQTFSGRVNVAFFKPDGERITAENDINWPWDFEAIPAYIEGGEIVPDMPFSIDFSSYDTVNGGQFVVPVGTRYIRFGGLTNTQSRDVVGTGYVSFSSSAEGKLF